MLENLKIENFRGFQSFELQQLGRVNLLVGQNNSGKTSILEAIQLLCSRTNLEPLRKMMKNRGEYFQSDESRVYSKVLDIRHLFHGHELKLDSEFSILGKNIENSEQLSLFEYLEKLIVSVGVSSRYKSKQNSDDAISENNLDETIAEETLSINIQWSDESVKEDFERPLSIDGGLSEEYIRRARMIDSSKDKPIKTQFITSSSLTASEMIEFFDQVILTTEEKVIQEALKMIEPNIERIAAVSSRKYRNSDFREGFVVLRADNHQRVPIGSFGDGTWRILGLALAIVNVKDGVLLVDEIDTGLHFTAMSKMWKLIWETAKRLNVQVFATTHNSDCWKSLASIACQENIHEAGGITIQRIEPDKNTAIAFNEREIVIAAERDIEVR